VLRPGPDLCAPLRALPARLLSLNHPLSPLLENPEVKIGCVREIKTHEYRVGLTPAGVEELVADGHQVFIESGAGEGSGLGDELYSDAGAQLISGPDGVWGEADLMLKVKEPQSVEWQRMRPGQTLFTYFHLAADEALTRGVLATGSHCIAYETLVVNGRLPLLEPMSEVAGRLAIQAGARCLEKPVGGLGTLLGGVPGVRPAKVLILGGGTVGTNSARMAAGLGADVVIADVNHARMAYLDEILPANCTTLWSSRRAIREELVGADLVVGAVLIPGAAAPKLVRAEDLKVMKPGSVIVDVAIDQGGCFETAKPTTHDDPTYVVDGVVHYCVANMPGAVPRTSTLALTSATLPWVRKLASEGTKAAIQGSPALAHAANALGGTLTCEPVGRDLGIDWTPVEEAAGQLA
jgi:alanine dehydrogenase